MATREENGSALPLKRVTLSWTPVFRAKFHRPPELGSILSSAPQSLGKLRPREGKDLPEALQAEAGQGFGLAGHLLLLPDASGRGA